MQPRTARILLIAGVLVPLVNAVRAKQPITIPLPEKKDVQTLKGLGINSDLIDQSTLPSAIDLKGSRPKADRNLFKSGQKEHKNHSAALTPPPNLALPNNPNEVKIRRLRPLSLNEVEKLVEINSPTLKRYSSQVEQRKSLLKANLRL